MMKFENVQLTLGWSLTRQYSHTFTVCSKQNKFVTFFFGHLHKPIFLIFVIIIYKNDRL